MQELATQAAETIYHGFISYEAEFRRLTRTAQARFEQRDWQMIKPASAERLALYNTVLQEVIGRLQTLLGDRLRDHDTWAAMKAQYALLADQFFDTRLAETYFNSATRRIFSTVGLNPRIEFVRSRLEPLTVPPDYTLTVPSVCRRYSRYRSQPVPTADLLAQILGDYPFNIPWIDLQRDAARCAERVEALAPGYAAIDMVTTVFYRGKGAYLLGRVICPHGQELPLLLALENRREGLRIDAAITSNDELSVVFSFTRSYFSADTDRPDDLIVFLKSLLPHKRVAELYITLGYNKHGKTELYWDFRRHMAQNRHDRFVRAPGERGMVMIVFTLPSWDMVFKVIKDRFDPPKTTTRAEVMACYDIVFGHDRAGRLADAQEFEHLEFARADFDPDLLEELLAVAANSVSLNGERVSIAHLYMERQMVPLNLWLGQVDDESADRIAIDYGQTIRDLASTNIFPGDLFLKNFGVTRNQRVVFYDYDELAFITDLNFRTIPRARHYDDELSDHAWYNVGPHDVFPQQFESFLGLRPRQKAAFMRHHADLLDPVWWRCMQDLIRNGEIIDIYPYDRKNSFPL
jgi:isocitrate dehydrogenase kinase/phosphatase